MTSFARKAVAWTIVAMCTLVVLFGGTFLGLLAGRLIYAMTQNETAAWVAGSFVLSGLVCIMGIGLGVYMVKHYPQSTNKVEYHVTDTMETLLVEAHRVNPPD